jgi:NAD-dependent dihydropyrimidine dehydrogenase PreA subunit
MHVTINCDVSHFPPNRFGKKIKKLRIPNGEGGKVYEIDQEKCRKDGDCLDSCPIGVIEKRDDGTLNVGEDCTDCGACEPVCETQAIHPMQ